MRKSSRNWIIAASVVILVVAAYVIAAWALGDRVPRGTTVAGVNIGGMTASEAKVELREALEPVLEGEIPVALENNESTLDPGEAGLEFDAAATVDPLVGFTLNPQRLWDHVAGSGTVEPVTRIDEDKLTRALFVLGEDFHVEPVDATINFVDGEPQTTPAEVGVELNAEQAIEVISSNWLTGSSPIELPAREIAPVITDEEVERARTEQAKPLISGPISVAVGDNRKDLSPDLLASAARFSAQGATMQLEIEAEMLADYLRQEIPKIEKAPKDAKIKLGDDGPKITPDEPGTKIDIAQLGSDVLAASHEEVRTVTLNFEETEADLTQADAEALGIKERISEFSTPITNDAVRTNNLKVGAEAISGVIVMPGETFSLIDTLGPITPENGYGYAGVIVNGVLKDGLGGGLSQVATTLYNGAFFAGMEDVEHKPHSQYISRYPEGREATIALPSVDLKFRNDTDHGVMIDSWVSDGQIHVVFWGTKEWDIKSEISPRREIVPAKVITNSDADCQPYAAGNPGFAVTVKRLFYKGDDLVKSESQSWRYSPQNGVRCEN